MLTLYAVCEIAYSVCSLSRLRRRQPMRTCPPLAEHWQAASGQRCPVSYFTSPTLGFLDTSDEVPELVEGRILGTPTSVLIRVPPFLLPVLSVSARDISFFSRPFAPLTRGRRVHRGSTPKTISFFSLFSAPLCETSFFLMPQTRRRSEACGRDRAKR
jgi:hypothetical protein